MTEPSQPNIEDRDGEFAEIRGHVVDFVSNREVIMDVGKAEGVQVGMRFVILGIVPVDVVVNGEKITDSVEIAKSIVRVVRLSGEHLSIGRTFRTIKGRPAYEIDNPSHIGGLGSSMMNRMAEPKTRYPEIPDRMETFGVESNETLRGRTESKVQKGDTVRLTTGDEFL